MECRYFNQSCLSWPSRHFSRPMFSVIFLLHRMVPEEPFYFESIATNHRPVRDPLSGLYFAEMRRPSRKCTCLITHCWRTPTPIDEMMSHTFVFEMEKKKTVTICLNGGMSTKTWGNLSANASCCYRCFSQPVDPWRAGHFITDYLT